MQFYFPFIIISAAFGLALNGTDRACGEITAQFLAANEGASFSFDPQLGLRCLRSTPINTSLALKYTQEIKKFVQFQSTLAYVKSPPPEYWYKPVDLLDGLDDLAHKTEANFFQNQYDFDTALYSLLQSAQEGHITVLPCTSSSIIFERDPLLISISQDGIKDPRIFLQGEVVRSMAPSKAPSHIVKINGKDAYEFLQDEALSTKHDPDSAYNIMFWNSAHAPDVSVAGAFNRPELNIYPGPTTILEFANGTSRSFSNKATIGLLGWSKDIREGESLFEYFCKPRESNSQFTVDPSSSEGSQVYGHPYTAVAKDDYAQIQGYFLDGPKDQDTAVLFVSSFFPSSDEGSPKPAKSFQKTAQDFLNAAKAANKKKLVVDVSGNPGGDGNLPLDLVKRLFPRSEFNLSWRMRMSSAAQHLVASLQSARSDSPPPPNTTDTVFSASEENTLLYSPFNYHSYLREDYKNFTGYEDFFPPIVANGDNFTTLFQPPLNSSYYDLDSDFTVPFGYGGQQAGEQPFLLENVVVLTDGFCASACAGFVHYLDQVGVKTIAVGGRPNHGPMQAIGGTKGTLKQDWYSIQRLIEILRRRKLLNDSDDLPSTDPLPLGQPSLLPQHGINLRDYLLPNAKAEGIPSQMQWEPADCHVYYTAETVANPMRMWETVANIAWGNGTCSWGSVRQRAGNSTIPQQNPIATASPSAGSRTSTEHPGMAALALLIMAILAAL